MTGTLRGYLISIAYCLFFHFAQFLFTMILILCLLAHLSRRLRGELIVYQSSHCLSIRPCLFSHFQT